MTRGVDGTSAVSHSTGETVRHILLAADIDEINAHVFNTGTDDHTQYHTAARHAAVVHTAAMLGTDSVGSDEIAAGAVGSSELGSGAVTAGKIATGGISAAAQFAAGVVDAAAIASDAVGAAEIAAGAVGSSELATDAVIAGKIADGAIDAAALFAAGVVDAAAIATNAVGSAELADNAVDTNAIAAAAVTDAKIETAFARGVIAQFSSGSDSSTHSVTGDSDMVLNNVSVVQNHVYQVTLQSRALISVSVADGVWAAQLFVNGGQVGEFDYMQRPNSRTSSCQGIVYWTAPSTQATDDFVVRLIEVGGTSTFQFIAAGTRTLTIIDLGVI
jgi:hypothetical protein